MEKEKKTLVIGKFGRRAGDTGSPEVQVAILTEKINEISGHLKLHKKDNSSRRGLLAMVNLRRRLLNYLSRENFKRYVSLTEELKIRRK